MHTPLCGHAVGQPVEYVEAAADKGIGLITFTCHIPMDEEGFRHRGIRMTRQQVPDYCKMVDNARERGSVLGVEVLCGIEAEVFPEEEKLQDMDTLLGEFSFDFVLGSLHHQLPIYQKWLGQHGISEDKDITDTYFKHLAQGVRSGRYHSMSHPDVIRAYGTLQHFDPQASETSIREFLQALVDTDTCMEVNTSGLTKGDYIVHPDPLILQWASSMGVKLTIGSDAHRPESVGQYFPEVSALLTKKGFDKLHYFRAGKRVAIDLEA